MDKFFKEIKRYGYTPIDVRDTFATHTEDTQIYYRTDHHWTTDGAYLAYKQAVKKDEADRRGDLQTLRSKE